MKKLKTFMDVNDECDRIIRKAKNVPKNCLSLLDVLTINEEVEKEREDLIDKCEKLMNKAIKTVDGSIENIDFAYYQANGDYLQLMVSYLDGDELRFEPCVEICKKGDKFEACAFNDKIAKEFITKYSDVISLVYDVLKEDAQKDCENKCNIKTVNSKFLAGVSMYKVGIYSNSLNMYDIFSFDLFCKSGTYCSNTSGPMFYNLNSAIPSEFGASFIDEFFSKIYVKVEDCPQYIQDAVAKRNNKVNKSGKRLSLTK